MIKANELRIGNWVNRTEGFKTFKSKVTGNVISCAASDGIIDFIEPIPLTPEILEKAGFEKDESVQQDWSLTKSLNGRIKIVFYKGDLSCLSLFQDDNLIDFPTSSIKYVHQLQNLYFALTGEELNISL